MLQRIIYIYIYIYKYCIKKLVGDILYEIVSGLLSGYQNSRSENNISMMIGPVIYGDIFTVNN